MSMEAHSVLESKGVLLVMLGLALVLAERWFPRRDQPLLWSRMFGNGALLLVSTVIIRLLFPLGLVGFATQNTFGLMHWLHAPFWLELAVCLLLLDAAIYLQHRLFHVVPWLWRAHRVHHSDTHFDVSLGLRFHPLEIIPSLGYKLVVILLLGAAPMTVAVYELLLLAFSLFTHANLGLPERVDKALRRYLVTPDWHRVHHDVDDPQSSGHGGHNFGNILTLWDRWFGTAREQPQHGHVAMQIGLHVFRQPSEQGFAALLWQPTRSQAPTSNKESDHA